MCGICVVVLKQNRQDVEDHLRNCHFKNRGPDHFSSHQVDLSDVISLLFCGCVLHLRGALTPQPIKDETGNVLLWNGEIFGGLDLKEEDNDTEALFHCLTRLENETDIATVFSTLRGPWAFIYWQQSKKKLWFGRDVFGRRSLLWHLPDHNTDDVFSLSSVSINDHSFQEVPSIGVYSLEFEEAIPQHMKIFPWKNTTWPGSLDIVNDENVAENLYSGGTSIDVCVQSHAPLSTWMPVLTRGLPPGQQTKLLNGDEMEEGLLSYLTDICIPFSVDNFNIRKAFMQFRDLLGQVIQTRVYNLPRKEVDSLKMSEHTGSHSNENLPMANVAVLFSGGIDSTVIAALADRCIPRNEPIDLINVAFEQRSKTNQDPKSGKGIDQDKIPGTDRSFQPFDVPDRLTGYTALSELNSLRQWNFIEVNVTAQELQKCREEHIQQLIYPLTSVLDDSIGCALWFAARGQGVLGNGRFKGRDFQSKAKVLLCGMGADEQLAGYSRHRVCFRNHGRARLLEELDMEMKRISARNLGRDDRIIGDHGKEARFPFLDERVIEYLACLPLEWKADLNLPRGLGEKLILRLVAADLQLPTTAVLPKRAIQFGSRIAKLENRKEKASDACTRLTPS